MAGEDPRNRRQRQRQRWFESAGPFAGRQTTAQLCTKPAARPVDDGLGAGGQLACSRRDRASGRHPGVGPVKARPPLRPARDGGGLSPSPRTVCRCRARWVGRPSASPGDTRRKRFVVWQPFLLTSLPLNSKLQHRRYFEMPSAPTPRFLLQISDSLPTTSIVYRKVTALAFVRGSATEPQRMVSLSKRFVRR